MPEKSTHLEKYALFILHNHTREVTELYLQKLYECNPPLLNLLRPMGKEQIFELSKKVLEENLLIPITQGNALEVAQERIRTWKANAVIVPKDQIYISDLTAVNNSNKSALLHFLKKYECSKEEYIELVSELEEYFNVQLSMGLDAYEEIQRGELWEKEEILSGVLKNIPVIVTRFNREGIITFSEGYGLELLGLQGKNFKGVNIFTTFPSDHTHKAMNGEQAVFTGTATSVTGQTRHYQSYFFPHQEGALGFSIDITERVVAEEKLKESQHFIQQIADSTPDVIQIYDLEEKRNVYVSKETVSLFGYTKEDIEAMGTSYVQALVHPEDVSIVTGRISRFQQAKDGEILETLHRIRHKNGGWRWVQSRGVVFKRNPSGEVKQYLSLVRDVTDKKLAEEKLKEFYTSLEEKVAERTKELQESEERFRAMAEFMPQMVFITSADGDIDYANKKWILYTGLDIEATKGGGWADALHPEDKDRTVRIWMNAVEKGIMYEVVYRFKRASDGMYRWHIGRALPFKDKEGKIVKWFGTCTDIHDQKMAEESVRLQARVLESMDEGVSVSDDQGYIIYTNQAEDAMFGYAPGELIGKHVRVQNAYSSEQNEKIVGEVIHQLRTKGIWTGEWENKRKDGTVFYTYSHITSLQSGDKNLFVCVQRDITEEKKNKETLMQRNQELQKINTDLDNFIYTASHDLRAPVSNIEGLMNALIDILKANNYLNDDVNRVVQMIAVSVKRFQGTIKELTEISKTQRSVAEDVEKIDVCSAIESITSDIQNLIKESNAIIKLDSSQCPLISFSRGHFRSIVYNLLTNAIKYRSPLRQALVEIKFYEDGIYNVIEVKDNGLGIKKEHQEKIFSMFKRMHDHVEGTGVGLYIVKRIIENSGGKIEVDSEEGKGSTFRVFFKA